MENMEKLKYESGMKSTDIILAVLYYFYKSGREEVSISEFQESVKMLQKKIDLGYSFSERLFYSAKLFSDLDKLSHDGFIYKFKYIHDAFLPKSYIVLKLLGKGYGEKIVEQLSPKTIHILNNVVINAVKEYRKTWKLWSRITKEEL